MKTIRLTLYSLATIFFLLFSVRCSDDSVTPLAGLSGTLTYTGAAGSSAASGAIVYLATSATGSYDVSSIADASGNYSFENLDAGTYYLSATYYSNNQNAAARLEGLTFGVDNMEVVIGSTDVTQDVTLVSSGQTNAITTVVDYDGLEGGAGNTGDWDFDAAHSSVDFAFDFDDGNAEFTGTFSRVTNVAIDFNPASLGSSSVSGEIDLLSVNTRTRGGRDPLWDGDYSTLNESTIFTETNCIAGTFGIAADAALPSVVTDPKRYASFATTSIEAYGDGYIAKGSMTFHGFTKSVSIIFKYRPGWEDDTRYYASFEGKMVFAAQADFDIQSSHILDEAIKVYFNIQMRKNK